MEENNKAYGYVRVSTNTQGTKGYGAETQEHSIKEHCKKHNLELVECFRDIGISGTEVDKRAGLMNLLSSLNGVSKVVVYDTSRLWRDDIATGCIKQALIRSKADVISIQQPDYSIYTKNPANFLNNALMQILDQYDRMNINLKLSKGRKTKARNGIKGCGTAPFGYKWSHEGNKPELVFNPQQHLIVSVIFVWYLKFKSTAVVANLLNEKGHRTTKGNKFSSMAVQKILRNSFYIGVLQWGGTTTKGKHEAIISPITFGKAQKMLDRNRKTKHANPS